MPDYSGVSDADAIDNIRKPLMSKSDQQHELPVLSIQTVADLCKKGRKCIRKDQHQGACWPS